MGRREGAAPSALIAGLTVTRPHYAAPSPMRASDQLRSRFWPSCARYRVGADGTAAASPPQRPAPPPPAAQPQKLTIGFVEIEGDPRYEPMRAYERLILKTREHPFAGAQVGDRRGRRAGAGAQDRFHARAHHRQVGRRGGARPCTQAMADAQHRVLPDRCAGRSLQAAGGGRQGPRRAALQRQRRPTIGLRRDLVRARDRARHPEPRHEHGRA